MTRRLLITDSDVHLASTNFFVFKKRSSMIMVVMTWWWYRYVLYSLMEPSPAYALGNKKKKKNCTICDTFAARQRSRCASPSSTVQYYKNAIIYVAWVYEYVYVCCDDDNAYYLSWFEDLCPSRQFLAKNVQQLHFTI